MKILSLCRMGFLFAPVLAVGQTSVRVNIPDLYDNVPPPPATVQEAYNRAECEGVGEKCTTTRFFSGTHATLADLEAKFRSASAHLTQPVSPALASIDPAEVQRKMASMSQSEQVAYAMAMAKQMSPGARVPEPEEVQSAVEEFNRLNQVSAAELQDPSTVMERWTRIAMERDRRHKEVDAWEAAEIQKLPFVDFSEAGKFRDAKAMHAISMKAMQKHIDVQNEYLKALARKWRDALSANRKRYARYQGLLEAVGYGDAAKNNDTKQTLLLGQQLMSGPLQELLQVSEEATREAVDLWNRRITLQANPPK